MTLLSAAKALEGLAEIVDIHLWEDEDWERFYKAQSTVDDVARRQKECFERGGHLYPHRTYCDALVHPDCETKKCRLPGLLENPLYGYWGGHDETILQGYAESLWFCPRCGADLTEIKKEEERDKS